MKTDGLQEHQLAIDVEKIGNLPRDIEIPDKVTTKKLTAEMKHEIENNKQQIDQLRLAVIGSKKAKNLEQKKLQPDPGDLNMQLALTRLVTDSDEQDLARKDGLAFQTKYNLSNNQMFTLCRLAVQIGFYKNTEDLNKYLGIYAGMSEAVRALTPDSAKRLGLDTGIGGIIGSCSCSCP
jgi:hypothetical protein